MDINGFVIEDNPTEARQWANLFYLLAWLELHPEATEEIR
jgi:hypothetical protein